MSEEPDKPVLPYDLGCLDRRPYDIREVAKGKTFLVFADGAVDLNLVLAMDWSNEDVVDVYMGMHVDESDEPYMLPFRPIPGRKRETP